MEKMGFLFPGQGAQYRGMGKRFYEASKSSRRIFNIASDMLKFDVARMCFEGDEDELSSTKNSQPAILTSSIACLRFLQEKNKEALQAPVISVAGLSLGEYSALVCADVIRFEDAVYIVRKRGEFMEEESLQNPGGMLSLLGSDLNTVKQLCEKTGLEIAVLNCPGQIVVSGTEGSIKLALEQSKDSGIKKVVRLKTSGPFHCSKMKTAADRLKILLDKIQMQKPKYKFICNASAQWVDEPEKIKDALTRQVHHPVLWENSMLEMERQGFLNFIELSPGKVLKNLAQRICSNFNVESMDEEWFNSPVRMKYD